MAVNAGQPRAPYASDPAKSRGRLYAEPPSPTRNEFRRDCDRIIHSTAFRRLAHKTQVFVFHEGDHFRTRLTHSLEVAQIARSLARSLGLDEDLAEALALAHDLGHPPFGHAGEHALDDCLRDYGGFDHNAQTLRAVTAIERRYAAFDGLNLTWETLEGLIKHNGPLTDPLGRPLARPLARSPARGVAPALARFAAEHGIDLATHASAEAQAAAIADDIAYDAHDIDDGLRAELFPLDDLREVALAGEAVREVTARYPDLEAPRRTHEVVRRLITRMIEDVIACSRERLAALKPRSADAVRAAGAPVVGFSPQMHAADAAIKGFLYPRMYRHARVARIMADAEGVVRDLYAHFWKNPGDMPPEWSQSLDPADAAARARRIGDYIAGMTDRYAFQEHARLLA
jgi:dGTPase